MIRRTLALTVLVLALCAVPAFGAAKTPDQVLHTKASSGRALMTAYSNLLVAKDKAAIARLLSPAFQIQRADGSHASRAQYLATLPDLRAFSFADLTQARSNGIVTVRTAATATLFVNGAMYNPKPAPQMTVFRWTGERWLLLAQGNFNLPAS
jgi:hypothetical protein